MGTGTTTQVHMRNSRNRCKVSENLLSHMNLVFRFCNIKWLCQKQLT